MDKELLIDLVRNEPRLWDQRIKAYHNRDIKSGLWESIGKDLAVEGERARKTWENLRDTFRRKYKGQHETKSGQGAPTPNKWSHFNSLLFLKDIMTLNNCPGHLTELEPATGHVIDEETENELVATNSSSTDTESPAAFVKQQKQKKSTHYDRKAFDNEKRRVDLTERHFRSKKQKCEDDEDFAFLLSLLPTIKQLNQLDKMKLRMKMLKDVTEALEAHTMVVDQVKPS